MAIKLKNTENEEPKVYGNENFGIPEDCTKKQKFSTVKLVFYIFAVTFGNGASRIFYYGTEPCVFSRRLCGFPDVGASNGRVG